MILPDYKPSRIPPGVYDFEIHKQPEVRHNKEQNIFMIFPLRICNRMGKYRDANHIFFPSEKSYGDLLRILGAEKLEGGKVKLDANVIGKQFKGELVYVQNKNDPTREWPKIINIRSSDDFLSSEEMNEKEKPEEDMF